MKKYAIMNFLKGLLMLGSVFVLYWAVFVFAQILEPMPK